MPGGEFLFVREGRTKMYMLDLRTGLRKKVPNSRLLLKRGAFLSPELFWLQGSPTTNPESPLYRPNYILDLTTGKRYELLNLEVLPRLGNREFDPKNFSYIESADLIFIHHYYGELIALPSNFRQHPENAVILYEGTIDFNSDMPNGKKLEELAEDLDLKYETIDFSLKYSDVQSPTGKYVVRDDGVYFSGTNTPVADYLQYPSGYLGGYYSIGYFRGWYYDESGVIVHGAGDYLFTFPGISNVYYIPSPVLKLNLPSEKPTDTPAP